MKEAYENRTRQFPNEASCLDISQINGTKAEYCAIGTWSVVGVRMLKLPSLEDVDQQSLDGDIIPRSILISKLDKSVYVMAGLGNCSSQILSH